jgi:hypothetical protein
MACAMEQNVGKKAEEEQKKEVPSLKELCIQEVSCTFPSFYFKILPIELQQLIQDRSQKLLQNHPIYAFIKKEIGLKDGTRILRIIKRFPGKYSNKIIDAIYLDWPTSFIKTAFPKINKQLIQIAQKYYQAYKAKDVKSIVEYYHQVKDFVDERNKACEMTFTPVLISLFNKLEHKRKMLMYLQQTPIELTREEEVTLHYLHPDVCLVLKSLLTK